MNPSHRTKASPAVLIVGVGMTAVGELWERSLSELALEAIDEARSDAGMLRPQAVYIANALAPLLSGQSQVGALLADFAGLRGVEATAIQAAGASGGMAVRQAYLALASGIVDAALVVGSEKVTDKIGPTVGAALAAALDADSEAIQGLTPAAQAALLMRRYLYEANAPAEALAGFSLTAHANAASNPKAMFRHSISLDSYRRAAMVSDPVNMLDAAPVADGAAALLLTRAETVPQGTPYPAVRILASAAATDALALHDRSDPLAMASAREAVHRAYEQAGITAQQIDLFELHDQFSIYAALSLEAAGFAERGQGWRLAQNGQIARDGGIPISTFGGSKARGDTVGATGVYQVAELVRQLQGRAAENQIADAGIGMAQCLGAGGATAVTHILCRFEAA